MTPVLLALPLLVAPRLTTVGPADWASATDGISTAPLVIVHTANTAGQLKSCGCAKKEPWGLPQQAALIQQLRAFGRPTIVVDSGDLSADPAEWLAVAQALALMKYDALTWGELDLAAARGAKLALPKSGPKLLGLAGQRAPEGLTSQPGLLLTVGGRRVGVVGTGVPPPGKGGEAAMDLCREARTLRQRGAGLVIALSSSGSAADVRLAQQTQNEVDLILGGQDWQLASSPLTINGVTIAPTAQGGKEISLLFPQRLDQRPLVWQWRRVPTSIAASGDPEVARVLQEHFQAETARTVAAAAPASAARVNYVRAEECAKCHPAQLKSWRRQAHASAVATLHREGRVLPECLACHSELHRRVAAVPAPADPLGGVECSACHGDGLLHALDPKTAQASIPREEVCRACHTPERSPEFDWTTYARRIRHR